MESLHFEAYVHVLAILWRQIFKELRGVTNSKGLELHPLELNSLYECLFDFGTLLQTDRCFDVFKPGFRAWPHIYKKGGRSKRFYGKIELNLIEDLNLLGSYTMRDDSEKYMTIMKQVFTKFGEGIHGSLKFTLHKYLRQTNGPLANDKRAEWESKAAQDMLCHNNNAERPFATMRAYNKLYPAMTAQNLSWLSHSLVNGTHRPAHVFGRTSKKDIKNMIPPGIALTAHPVLRQAVNVLCSVRTQKSGAITNMVREANEAEVLAKNALRKSKAKEDFDENVRLKSVRLEKRDKAEYIAMTALVSDAATLAQHLAARKSSKKSRLTFLTEQYHARVSGVNPRIYPGLGDEFRNKYGKLRITPKLTGQCGEAYLLKLVKAMMLEDVEIGGVNESRNNTTIADCIRQLPSISKTYTNLKALSLKAEFSKEVGDLATPQDDPVYLELVGKYIGAVLYDNETRASQKLYRIVAVQYVLSYTVGRASCWEATCEPVYRDAATGKFLVPQALMVEGSSIIQTNALLGYALAEYTNGPESVPTYLPWIQNYIDHFRSFVEPKYACKTGKDLPSKPETSSHMDLPSKPKTSRTPKTSPPMDLPSKPKTSRTPCRPRKRFRSS
jgi:hypothetical protein